MNKDNLFFLIALIGIISLILLVFNIDLLFPLPSEEETLQHFASLDQQSTAPTERGTNPNATVTVEEFSDFQCPYCKAALPVLQQLHQDYGDSINLVYKHAPMLELHPQAGQAAEASECARDQGTFWAYHDKLFERQERLDQSSLQTYAAELGLDTTQFNTCLQQRHKANVIEKDLQEAVEKGVQGTPTFFVNGLKVSGANYEQLVTYIDQQLEVTA